VSLVLDAGGLTALAGQRARLHELRRRGLWPAQVPTVVLTEALTGDHRRDFHINRLLRTCQIRDVDETQAREAARLRAATGRAGTISAVDALVVALAGGLPDAVVLTNDPLDLRALAEHTAMALRVVSTSPRWRSASSRPDQA
jgi:predicted nucleic acid-binding protein